METSDIKAGRLYRVPSGETATVDHVYGRGRNRKVQLSAEVAFPGFRFRTKYIQVRRFAWHAVEVADGKAKGASDEAAS